MSENIEQPLPSTFEEFNEQRKAAFIRVKDYKQAGAGADSPKWSPRKLRSWFVTDLHPRQRSRS